MSEPTGSRALCDGLDAAPVNPEVTQLCCALRDWSVDLLMDQRERVADLLESLVQPEPQGPTMAELMQLWGTCNYPSVSARAFLARWGRPANNTNEASQ